MNTSEDIWDQFRDNAAREAQQPIPIDSDKVWDKITEQLDQKTQKKTIPFYKIGIAASFILIVSSVWMLIVNNSDQKDAAVQTTISTPSEQTPSNTYVPLNEPTIATMTPEYKEEIVQHTPHSSKRSRKSSTIPSEKAILIAIQPDSALYAMELPEDEVIGSAISGERDHQIIPYAKSGYKKSHASGNEGEKSKDEKSKDVLQEGIVVTMERPDQTDEVKIRGISSISPNTTPLLVVDGTIFTGDPSTINPKDIKTSTVIKDASATSLYGARGSNGVIVITTKTGHKQAKKAQRETKKQIRKNKQK